MITTQERMMGLAKPAFPVKREDLEQRRQRRLAARKKLTLAYWKALQEVSTVEALEAVNAQYALFCQEEKAAGLLSELACEYAIKLIEGHAAGIYQRVEDELIKTHKSIWPGSGGIRAVRT